MAKEKFYVTTAIDYPNAEPHIGHAYQKVIADVLARWNKQKGKDVLFLTGTDEHGKKIQESAEKAGKKPREFVDGLAVKFKEAWSTLNVDYDRFIRTTDKDHQKLVQEVIKKCSDNGDIYKGEYEGLYCIGCEAYYTDKDLEDGNCPVHKTKIEKLKEETYFFKLSKYEKFLLDLYKKDKDFILPKERKNEIVSRVKDGLKDLSITRTSFDWGIPFPLDKAHIVYVWFDALFNYVTGAGENGEYWPANLHLLGKDNSWFHCVYWPAFLKSAGYALPKTVFVHGFLTFNGQKISKSLGNVISPKDLVDKYGSDSVRYYLTRHVPFGQDGDFSEKALVSRHNDELANKLGNLVSRVAGLIEQSRGEDPSTTSSKSGQSNGLEKTSNKLIKKLREKEINEFIDSYQLDKALNLIFAFIDRCNEYVQENKVWENKDKKVLYELKESILKIAELLFAFIPESSEKITKQFSAKNIKKGEILFKKVE